MRIFRYLAFLATIGIFSTAIVMASGGGYGDRTESTSQSLSVKFKALQMEVESQFLDFRKDIENKDAQKHQMRSTEAQKRFYQLLTDGKALESDDPTLLPDLGSTVNEIYERFDNSTISKRLLNGQRSHVHWIPEGWLRDIRPHLLNFLEKWFGLLQKHNRVAVNSFLQVLSHFNWDYTGEGKGNAHNTALFSKMQHYMRTCAQVKNITPDGYAELIGQYADIAETVFEKDAKKSVEIDGYMQDLSVKMIASIIKAATQDFDAFEDAYGSIASIWPCPKHIREDLVAYLTTAMENWLEHNQNQLTGKDYFRISSIYKRIIQQYKNAAPYSETLSSLKRKRAELKAQTPGAAAKKSRKKRRLD